MKEVVFQDLANMGYKQAWDYQEQLFNSVVQTKIANRTLPDEEKKFTKSYLLFVEHPPVYTLGKSGDMKHLLLTDQQLKDKGIEFYKNNRGGDITYHGPGQNVGYPILDLDNFFTDIGKYLRLLEETIIHTLAEYGIIADRIKGLTGVWLDWENPEKARKICAMGVKCSRWVTMHGWAFNINTDLSYFKNIIPCGIDDKDVTSMQRELGYELDMEEVKGRVKKNFTKLFDAYLIEEPLKFPEHVKQ